MDGSLFLDWPTQPARDDSRPMIIDSFAGGGGASTGIEMALGRSPDVAINHNPAALALHEANHPHTLHLINSIYAVDPDDVCHGRHVGLAWFSPDCKHFSKAKGGKPVEKGIRDLAWVVVHWAKRVRPDVIMLENVEEFEDWCPLTDDHMPDTTRKGETFTLWVRSLRRLGYKIQWRVLRACDYGAPTIRKRLFVIARRDGRDIVWPKPTHFPTPELLRDGFGNPDDAKYQPKPYRTAAECIDWSLPCPSIFDTSEQIKAKHGLRANRPLADNTLARVARGMKRYVLDAQRPFIVNLTHGARVEDLATPLRTITGANRGEKSVIVPSITRFNGGATGQDLRAPLATVTANSYIKRPGGAAPLGLLAPSLMSMKGTARRDSPINAPHPTVLAGGGHSAMIAPVLTYAQQGGACRDIREPHHTICANSKDQNAVIIPTLIQTGYGERHGQAPRTLDIGAPLGTIVAGGIKHATAAAFLAQQNGGPKMDHHAGRDPRDPMSTVTAAGSQQTPVAAFFAKYYGTGDGARHDEPAHTITVKDRFAHTQAEMAVPPFSKDHEARAREVAEFLRAHGAWDGGEFVTLTIDGTDYVIVDIGLRMLTPRELFNCQGFPRDYVIDGVWHQSGDTWTFKSFPKNVQVSCVGNSVAPDIAAALVSANCAHLIEKEMAA
ncbi:DNA cytosine methyltransferase [Roseobacter sp. TSBP12]|uniref:DNA cytosine methyltransferase n=1 Tax=Roseobacter sp. TSBP12 TaxID=1236613 RepID=UPI00125F1A6A|nr:DNA cytosine methyltransferase [Roseobacter sp. TSBP12]KAB6714296.1 DNA methyltransferase [Roseobacter sp. TSBP12]